MLTDGPGMPVAKKRKRSDGYERFEKMGNDGGGFCYGSDVGFSGVRS